MTDEEWERALELDAKWLEMEWLEWLDEQDYYSVCRDS